MSITKALDLYEEQSAALMGVVPGLDALRKRALERIKDAGFPVGAEHWRYTDIGRMTGKAYQQAGAHALSAALPEMLDGVKIRFVFVNGIYSEELSTEEHTAGDIRIRRLVNHFMTNPARAEEVEIGVDGIGWLNTALMKDGFVITAPTNASFDYPIEILYLSDGAAETASHPRLIVDLGESARVTLIERYVSLGEGDHWTNAVTQIRLSEGSTMDHLRLIEGSAKSTIFNTTHIRAGAEAVYNGLGTFVSSGIARLETHAKILGQEAAINVDGISLAASGESHDSLVHVDHRVGEATSDQVYRTVSARKGTSSFAGKVTVAKDAQKTEADQSFKALLLDRTGTANAKPELEILADDVKCSHGATVGELDKSALFYLEQRGIDPLEARKLLVRSFLGDALVRFENTVFADAVGERIADWFNTQPDGAADA